MFNEQIKESGKEKAREREGRKMGSRPAGRCDKGRAKGRRVETANVQVILRLPHLPFSRSILSPPLGSRKLIPEDFLTSLPPSCIQPIGDPQEITGGRREGRGISPAHLALPGSAPAP